MYLVLLYFIETKLYIDHKGVIIIISNWYIFICTDDDYEGCPPCGQYERCDVYTDYDCVCDNGFTGSPGNCSGKI